MSRDIRALSLADLSDLSRFLTAGFHAAEDADFAAPDVLRWKYLDPIEPAAGIAEPCSYLARDESGAVIGHIGLCRTAFEGQALAAEGHRIDTIHIIDWLGSSEHRAVGMSLMRRAHTGVPTQFGLGVSPAALVVGERAGYDLISLVPACTRVLRPGYWFRAAGMKPLDRVLRLGRDLVQSTVRRASPPRSRMELQKVAQFGPEIDPIIERAQAHAILTHRDRHRLNHFLRFPRQAVSGWHLRDEAHRLRGFALLNVIPTDQGRTRTGKVVDCLLDDVDADAWDAAVHALTRQLAAEGADLALGYASTPWAVNAYTRSGFVSRFGVKFHIRDRQHLLPKGATYHLTPLEGDYGYT